MTAADKKAQVGFERLNLSESEALLHQRAWMYEFRLTFCSWNTSTKTEKKKEDGEP
jgi:hypothetical protein